MTDSTNSCRYVCDCAGLYAIATRNSNNERAVLLQMLQSGTIAVPSIVLKEFREIYEEEAKEIEQYISHKIRMVKKHHLAVASLVDRNGHGFPDEPYGKNGDLYCAAISEMESLTLVTSSSDNYASMSVECAVLEVGDLVTDV